MHVGFLNEERVRQIHAHQIRMYGGSDGIRDALLLQSAVMAPRATFGGVYLHESIPDMAAAYLFHLVCNHPFVDGNKRTGLAAAVLFLNANGFSLDVSNEEAERLTLDVASGCMNKDEVRAYMLLHAKRRESAT